MDLINLSLPWWDFVIRALAVYIFLLAMLRLTGKKQVGQFSSFDFVLLLILSNAVQNSMNGGDNSLLGGLILASTLILFNWLMDYLGYKIKGFSHLTEGGPELLVHNGKPILKILEKEKISLSQLDATLRDKGVSNIADVRFAILEANGHVSVIKKDEK